MKRGKFWDWVPTLKFEEKTVLYDYKDFMTVMRKARQDFSNAALTIKNLNPEKKEVS